MFLSVIKYLCIKTHNQLEITMNNNEYCNNITLYYNCGYNYIFNVH